MATGGKKKAKKKAEGGLIEMKNGGSVPKAEEEKDHLKILTLQEAVVSL